MRRIPLNVTFERFRLYAAGLTLIGLAQVLHSAGFAFWDWTTFAYAADHAGTAALLQPPNMQDAFVYVPGAALILAPLHGLSPAAGFALNAAVMLVAFVAAGFVAQRIYGLRAGFCIAMIAAWAPATYAVVVGQNAPLCFLLVLLSLLGSVRGIPALTAIPVGLLLYKPTIALPLIGLLLLRGRGRELAIVAVCGVGWYVASVVATGGDWTWPVALAQLERGLFAADFALNAPKALGLTTLLLRAGIPGVIVAGIVTVVVAASLPALKRLADRERYAAICLLGLVLSPHAWSYEGILVLPMIFVVVTQVREPQRTRLICVAYAIAPLILLTQTLGYNPLAIVVIGGFVAWFILRSRSIKQTAYDSAA